MAKQKTFWAYSFSGERAHCWSICVTKPWDDQLFRSACGLTQLSNALFESEAPENRCKNCLRSLER